MAVAKAATEAEVLAATVVSSKDCVFGDREEEEGSHPRVGGKILLEGKEDEREKKKKEEKEEEALRRRSRSPPP